MRFKALLFDVDGVLVDSEKVFNTCWRRAAELEGYSMTFDQALELRSLDSRLAGDLFISWYNDERAYQVIRSHRKQLMADYNKKHLLEIKPGVLDFLKRMNGELIKVAIVTSSPIRRISDYLSSVGIDVGLFDSIITTEQVKFGKPFPDVYRFACESLGFAPSECVAVEDSPNGVKAAHNAGCFTVMIPDLSPYTDDLSGFVDAVCPSMYDLDSVLL